MHAVSASDYLFLILFDLLKHAVDLWLICKRNSFLSRFLVYFAVES